MSLGEKVGKYNCLNRNACTNEEWQLSFFVGWNDAFYQTIIHSTNLTPQPKWVQSLWPHCTEDLNATWTESLFLISYNSRDSSTEVKWQYAFLRTHITSMPQEMKWNEIVHFCQVFLSDTASNWYCSTVSG